MNNSQQPRNVNKTNAIQKKIMVDFMLQHPELARNTLLTGNHGKKIAQRLWNTLTAKLNAAGPPVKDVKIWRKVYSDQKHLIKKKISMQKSLADTNVNFKRVDQQIIRAAGLNDDTEDENSMSAIEQYSMHSNMPREDPFHNAFYNQNHQRFDIIEIKEEPVDEIHRNNHNNINDDDEDDDDNEEPFKNHIDHNNDAAMQQQNINANPTSVENMVTHLHEQFQDFADDQKLASAKLDRLIKMNEDLIKMKERSLKMKEEQHAMDMALKRIDLEIKTLELKALKSKSVVNVCI